MRRWRSRWCWFRRWLGTRLRRERFNRDDRSLADRCHWSNGDSQNLLHATELRTDRRALRAKRPDSFVATLHDFTRVLEIPENTVYSRVRRAKGHLRSVLTTLCEHDDERLSAYKMLVVVDD